MDTSTEGAAHEAHEHEAAQHEVAGHEVAEHDHAAHHQHGYGADKARIRARLSRIEGQVRGIGRMVDDDTYCIDILTQVSAATRALENVALLLLEDHLDHCVRDAARRGGPEADEKLAEATAAIARLVRS
jgi:DNA-binding FrmR family transcriptional regulator